MELLPMEERTYLRDLAKRQREYAALPVMAERTRRWYGHNAMEPGLPMVVMELSSFKDDLLPPLRCASALGRRLEEELLLNIVSHEQIDDDKVMPDYITAGWEICNTQYGVEIPRRHAVDGSGRSVGFAWTPPVQDLERDFYKLKKWEFSVDRDGSLERRDHIEDVLGDILRVEMRNDNTWSTHLSNKAVDLMGMENMMFAFCDYPEGMHRLYGYLTDSLLAFLQFQEDNGLLTLNNGNHYAGAGSYGFTRELPGAGYDGKPRLRDLWVNLNSQETVGISPDMYGEFIYPYYEKAASRAGLVYYGCCEPVHPIWDKYLSRLPNLRKVSISAWCDEAFMGERLCRQRVIYSRKPRPNFIGAQQTFDEDGFSSHIRGTLEAARGCTLEFIFRDIYTLMGDPGRAKRAVEITREQIGRHWRG